MNVSRRQGTFERDDQVQLTMIKELSQLAHHLSNGQVYAGTPTNDEQTGDSLAVSLDIGIREKRSVSLSDCVRQ